MQLTCYRLLQAKGDGDAAASKRADDLLTQAHEALMEQAGGISDTQLRQKFLENVKPNQEIIATWRARVA